MARNILSVVVSLWILRMAAVTASGSNSDGAACNSQMQGLANCFPYEEGSTAFPTKTCCDYVAQGFTHHLMCMCVVIREIPISGLWGIKVNVTRVLELPETCNTVSYRYKCIELLNIPPGSQEAQLFIEDRYPSSAANGGASGSTSSSSDNSFSSSCKSQMKMMAVAMFFVVAWNVGQNLCLFRV